jgi:hypothetical protein
MASLILRRSTAEGGNQEFPLRPGSNTVGRSETNSLVIEHPSISGRHCEVVWEAATVRVRDLGSTNGTFIDRQPVQEGSLRVGQFLSLGGVELVLAERAEGTPPPELQMPPPPDAPPLARPLVTPVTRPPVAPAASTEVEPPRGFLRSLPGALVYPLHRNGIFLLVAGTVVFGAVEFLASLTPFISLAVSVACTGYLFAYVQKIMSASAQGEMEMPDYPEFSEWWSDIVQPFLLLTWTLLFCFGPGAALFAWGNADEPALAAGALGLLILGGLYFPMALLAVGVADSFLALNPAVVIPSIFRVFGHYLVVCLVLAVLGGLRVAGGWLAGLVPLPVLPALLNGFIALYFIAAATHILGRLYFFNRHRLGWFS